MVGGVDAGGIVDRVGVDATAAPGIGDAPELGEAKVGALADHRAAQLGREDADRIVGLVPDLGVALARRLHIGADAPEVEQLAGRPQHRADQLCGRQSIVLDVQDRLDLGRQGDGLGGAREHAAAGGDQARIVVGPG